MAGSVDDLGAPPESWEVADLDASMARLMLKNRDSIANSKSVEVGGGGGDVSASSVGSSVTTVASDDVVNSVDQFLREAIQNPRERVSVLRMEQDVEKFIRDPTRQQMEFQQLPTSYLRLAAHRVAQHYSLQSMVLLDNSLPDGTASKIIVRKTSECRLPAIRLADIPVNLPTENSGVVKVAIKQRPQKRSQGANSGNSHSKNNSSKSVEERKEEYNKARARIFNSATSSAGPAISESVPRVQDRFHHGHGSIGMSRIEEPSAPLVTDTNVGRSLINSAGSSRSSSSGIEKEPVGRIKTNNRVAIFRDREVERKDPDFDRSYDRYAQRFDPGFGFNGGPYAIQPLYSPVLNYSTEFPQLGSAPRPSIPSEHQPRPLPQHLPGPWVTSTTPTGIGYVPSEAMMTPPFSPNHVGNHSASALYLHSTQFPRQLPGMQFIHPHEQVYQTFPQSHHQQPDASFGLARPR